MPIKTLSITFAGLQPGEQAPDLALYRLAEREAPVKLARIVGGSIDGVDLEALKGVTLAIGPDADPKDIDPGQLIRYRVEQMRERWLREGLLIPRERWGPLIGELVCVSGDVRKCRPWWLEPVWQRATLASSGAALNAGSASALRVVPVMRPEDFTTTVIRWPWRCLPLCEGVVEIFERVCCCRDIRLPDLIDKLRDILKEVPIAIDWPRPPIPDPGPLARLRRPMPPVNRATRLPETPSLPPQRLFEDYQALLAIRPQEVESFVKARPYLWGHVCSCTVRKVGETPIRPGGEFDFCYRRPRRLTLVGERCSTNFAFRVRQQIGGAWTTIYDGVAGADYFAQGEEAHLQSYDPRALPCGDGPPPPDQGDGTAFVMLEHVTGAGTHHFNFPAQTALSRMGAMGADSGLIDFAGVPDAPWATTLGLRLWFSPTLEGTIAYYRLKVVRVDAAGNPVGAPRTLDTPVSWLRYVTIGGSVQTIPDALAANPSDVGGELGLFRVPYWSGGMDWLSGQYHQLWDTTTDAPGTGAGGRFMLTLEVFGPGGARVKPASAPAGDPGTARPFQFRRWTSQTVTANVPFGDCAHVFWLNNRPVAGRIVDLRKDGMASSDECQFMSGPGTTTFSVGFRAYHLDGVTTGGGPSDTDSFMASYALTWQRGLNGPSGTIETGTADKGEAGAVPSAATAFATLLGAFPPTWGAQQRCTFSVHLHVDAKHHNGGSFIDAYDYRETASFALELKP